MVVRLYLDHVYDKLCEVLSNNILCGVNSLTLGGFHVRV